MRELRFYKTEENKWFLYAPRYIEEGGDPAELEMVLGADTLLDVLADEKNEVVLGISQDRVEEGIMYAQALRRVDEIPTLVGKYYHDDTTELLIWLCPVTLWVFNGVYPETIWYKKI